MASNNLLLLDLQRVLISFTTTQSPILFYFTFSNTTLFFSGRKEKESEAKFRQCIILTYLFLVSGVQCAISDIINIFGHASLMNALGPGTSLCISLAYFLVKEMVLSV